MKIDKLDGRFRGHRKFKYFVQLAKYHELALFQEMREWCWSSFGPSAEINLLLELQREEKWSWDITDWSNRILFRDEATLNWFRLKYDNTEKIRRL